MYFICRPPMAEEQRRQRAERWPYGPCDLISAPYGYVYKICISND
jgi:hypothetical protein